MIYNPKLDKILNSSTLSSSIFLISGGYKTYSDYRSADEKYKKRFLIKDTVVLSGAATGLILNHMAGKKIRKTQVYEKAVTKISQKINETKYNSSLKYTKSIVKELFSGFMSTASGILGALGTDYILSKTKFKQPKRNQNEPEKNRLLVYVDNNLNKFGDKNTRDAIYTSFTDMPAMKFVSSSLIGAEAIELAKEKELEKKLTHTTKYLVNDTLVPLLFLSISSALTKNLKPVLRLPLIFTVLTGGTLLFKKITEKKGG